MNLIKKNPYTQVLKDAYINDKLKNCTSDFCRQWVEHKYKHSIEVTEAGIKIMQATDAFKDLDKKIIEQYVSALLMHDVARPKEIDHATGKVIVIDHAVEGARFVEKLGEKSLNIIIPVMVHSRYDESFIEVDEKDLFKKHDFKKLSDKDKKFVLKYRKKFMKASEEDKNLIMLGVYLVKDADKIANMLEANRMFSLDEQYADNTKGLSKKIVKQLFDGTLVRIKDVKSMIDYIWYYMAWFNDLKFKTSKKFLQNKNILENAKKMALKKAKNFDKEDYEFIKLQFNDAIKFLKRKIK